MLVLPMVHEVQDWVEPTTPAERERKLRRWRYVLRLFPGEVCMRREADETIGIVVLVQMVNSTRYGTSIRFFKSPAVPTFALGGSYGRSHRRSRSGCFRRSKRGAFTAIASTRQLGIPIVNPFPLSRLTSIPSPPNYYLSIMTLPAPCNPPLDVFEPYPCCFLLYLSLSPSIIS